MTDHSGVTAGVHPPDLEHVPTVAELAKRGLAHLRQRTYRETETFGKPKTDTRYEITPEGQQLILDAMKRNAERGRAWDAQRRMNAAVDAGLV